MGVMDTVKGWFGTAKETASDLTEKAKPHVESAVEKTKETASDLTEKAKEKVSDMKSGAKETAAEATETVADTAEEAAEKIDE